MLATLSKTIFFCAIAACAIWVAWMAADNERPYAYAVERSYIIPDPAQQGAMVTASWAIEKVNRPCGGTSQRYFRDLDPDSSSYKEIVSTLDTTQMSRALKLGDKRLPRSFQLPPQLPKIVGYSTEICAQCNLLQHIFPLCFRTPEIIFRVIQ